MQTLKMVESLFLELFNNKIKSASFDLIQSQYDDVLQVIETCEQILEEKDEDSSRVFLLDSFSLDKFVNRSSWSNDIIELLSELPQNVKLSEEDIHLTIRPDESGYISFVKRLKRIKFAVLKSHSQRIFSCRNVVAIRFVNYLALISKWEKTRFAICSNLLVQAKDQLLIKYSNQPDNIDLKTILSQQKHVLMDAFSLVNSEATQGLEQFSDEVIKDLSVAGTVEYRANKFSKEVVDRKIQILTAEYEEAVKVWKTILEVNREQLQALMTLNSIYLKLDSLESDLLQEFHSEITGVIEQPLDALKSLLVDHQTKLKNKKKFSTKELDQICETIKVDANTIVQNRIYQPLIEVADEKRLSKILDDFAAKVELLANEVEPNLTLIDEFRFNEYLPEFEFQEIQWQALFRRILGDEYLTELLPEGLLTEKNIIEIADDFLEVDQIIATNLTVAQDIENEEDEGQYDIIEKGIELAQLKIDYLSIEYQKIESNVSDQLRKHQKELSDRIFKLLLLQDAGQMKRVDTHIKVKQSAINVQERASIYWARFMDRFELMRRFGYSKISNIIEEIREFFGLMEVEHINIQKTNIAALLHETDLKFRELPYIYRRLFDFKLAAESPFFVRSQPLFEAVSNSYKLWQSGFPSSLVILGEKGSGRTTMLKYIEDEYFENEKVEKIIFIKTIFDEKQLILELCTQLKIQPKEHISDLALLLNRRRKKSVIVVENLQNCFLRTVNGYNAIQALLYLMSETREKILWVGTCSRYAWNFLNVAVKISDFFTHSISVDSQSDKNIEELIIRRQVASGYQLQMVPSVQVIKSRAYKKILDDPEKVQVYLKELFFERLNKMAEGNPTVAMIFWIRSIQKIEGAEILIKPIELNGIEYLSELDSQVLFVLTAFVLHDVLNANELAITMNINKISAETMISRLCTRGLLLNTESGCSLNDLIYRQVVRLLISKNLINA